MTDFQPGDRVAYTHKPGSTPESAEVVFVLMEGRMFVRVCGGEVLAATSEQVTQLASCA